MRNKLIQYRCCDCKSLMFKYRIGAESLEFTGMNAKFIDCLDKKKDVVCLKCGTRMEIAKGELKKIELTEVLTH